MIDMRVGEYDCVDGFGIAFERQVIALLDIFRPLVEPAVDIDAKVFIFE